MAWHEVKKAAGSGTPNNTNRGVPTTPEELKNAIATSNALAGLDRCDARSIWAQASKFAGYTRAPGAGSKKRVPVAIEVDVGASLSERRKIAKLIRLRGVYPLCPKKRTFWTGAARVVDLASLSKMNGVFGWRIGLENIPQSDRKPAPGYSDVQAWGNAPKSRPLIGIIDHGVAIAHLAFRYPGAAKEPRVLSLWDQDPDRLRKPNNPIKLWEKVVGLGYGGELNRKKLKQLIGRSGGIERCVYEELKYEPVLGRVSHGTHVLDLAAGWPNPLSDAANLGPETVSDSPIVAVQLPYKPARDSSGSALCVHVLDALHYILSKAKSKQKVVINLSDGAYGGPHDGGSMLERAIDDFLTKNSRVTLVLAAGNARDSSGHAQVKAPNLGKTAELKWRVLPDDYTDSFLEVWFDTVCADRSVTLIVTPPNGLSSVTVPMGSTELLLDASGYTLASVISMKTSPDGLKRSMFLIAIAPTNPKDKQLPAAPHGVWKVEIRNDALDPAVKVNAWIERDNPVFNESGPRRQSFFEDSRCNPLVVTGQGTLGSLAGSGEAIVVGGRYRRGSASIGCNVLPLSKVAKYSSRGPGRAGHVQGPDLIAPSDDSPVLAGLLAAANRSGAKFRMDGTSVAAPIVTRRVGNILGAQNPPSNRTALMLKLLGPPPLGNDPNLAGERGYVEPGVEPTPAPFGPLLIALKSKAKLGKRKAKR